LFILYSFSLPAQRKRIKRKGTRVSCLPEADTLCSSNLPGLLKLARLRRTQTVNNLFPAASPVLGNGPMGFKTPFKEVS
jgi:hypothetical protein